MSRYTLAAKLELHPQSAGPPSDCFAFAVNELSRLLGRVGVGVERQPADGGACWALRLTTAGQRAIELPDVSSVTHDGYAVRVGETGLAIAAPTDKGALNGVYEIAERLGFVFLRPGEHHEWRAATNGPPVLEAGDSVKTPRFAHRGVHW